MADAGLVTDDALMTLAAADDAAAFSTLIRRHEQAVLRYLRQALPDVHDAHDVCQDVFVEVWRRRQSYEPRGTFAAWLFRMVRSRATSRGRFHAVRRLFAARVVHDDASGPRPDALYDERVAAAQVRKALQQVPATLREAVALRHGADLDHRTIAAILEVDEATARQRACRGLAVLRERLSAAERP